MKSNYYYTLPYIDTASVVLDSFFVSVKVSAADFVYFIPSIQSAIFRYSPGSSWEMVFQDHLETTNLVIF